MLEYCKAALGAAIGIKGVLKKRRILYMVGQTRVHIDHVFELGNFMELEVSQRLDVTNALLVLISNYISIF